MTIENKLMNVVIFSKNRAAQVELCLRSLVTAVTSKEEREQLNISVIWLATEPEYEQGYQEVQKLFEPAKDLLKVNWVRQSMFKRDLLACVSDSARLTMFLVDDDVFIDNFSLKDGPINLVQTSSLVVAASLRLWQGSTYCYPLNRNQKIPEFIKGNVWKWQGQDGDWGYPMSVDGNVFRTTYVKPLCESGVYRNPNEFESMLMSVSSKPEYMVCYKEGSKLVNIPANLVQTVNSNRHGNVHSTKELNDNLLAGKVIDTRNIWGQKPNAPHLEMEYKFVQIP